MMITQFKKTSAEKKILVVLLAVCVLCFVVTSSVFSIGVHHDCTGEDCIVCFFITMGERINACTIFVLLVATAVILGSFSAHFCAENTSLYQSTPVYLKVKLSN